MVKRRVAASAPADGVAKPVAVPIPSENAAGRPSAIRFPILVISSFALSWAAHELSSNFAEGDLAAVSRSTNEWAHIAGYLGGRVVELGLGWWGRYDGMLLRTQGYYGRLIISRRRHGILDVALTHALLPAPQDFLRDSPDNDSQ